MYGARFWVIQLSGAIDFHSTSYSYHDRYELFQRVGKDHQLNDEDVVQVIKKH